MKLIGYLSLLLFLLSWSACSDDDPEIITEIVTVHDTIIVIQHDTTLIIQHDTSIIIVHDTSIITLVDTVVNIISDDSAVVAVCVRHAETTGIGGNPSLSAAGQQRAIDLSHALSNMELARVYSTNFNRTRESAASTAMDQGLSVDIYNAFDIPAFANDIRNQHKGESILVVGHSNTTPQLLNELTQTSDYIVFGENTYDNLFIVSVKINGETTVYHLEYGTNTP